LKHLTAQGCVASWRRLVGFMFLALVASVTGCASSGGSSSGRADLMTASDETPARKKARIRLELAVGYFSNGQTTIALDEIKQSINADPTMMEAYNLRGLIYMRLNDFALAEDSFKRALSLDTRAATVMHNYGWMLCQQTRFNDAAQWFTSALANPEYADRPKTLMAQGLCQMRSGKRADAEKSLQSAYELDAANPVTGYNLALLLYQRGEFTRAQFLVRRINNSELANAESLWLGIKVERRLANRDATAQLASQLKKRFAQSPEAALFDRGAFDE
jgi:type IV pilus assembly protein PilF